MKGLPGRRKELEHTELFQKALFFKYFQEFIGEEFIVFACIAYVCKDLCQGFFVVFGNEILVKSAVFLFQIESVDICRGEVVICFIMHHGIQG